MKNRDRGRSKNSFFSQALILLVCSGCATSGTDNLKFGARLPESIDGERFLTELPGMIQIAVYPNKKETCDIGARPDKSKDKAKNGSSASTTDKARPSVSIKSETDVETALNVKCDTSKSFYVASSEKPIEAGRYTIKVSGGGSLYSSPRGRLSFAPTEAEKFSGADKLVEGSTKLADGVNTGTINQGKADATDWWVLEVKSFTPYGLVFQHDGKNEDVKVTLYNKQAGRLKALATMTPDQVYNRRMEGMYFIQVKGKEFSGESNYTISAQKGDTPAEVAEKRDQYESIDVADLWHMEGSRTAIVVGAGTSKGIKVGDNLKIFNKASNVLVGVCVAVGASEKETECHVESTITLNTKLVARKAL